LGLENLADILRRDFKYDPQAISGTGAAGGLAVPFLLLGQTTLQSGLDLVLDQMNFDEHLYTCDLVITGEGRTDEQSAMGKVLSGVARRSRQAGKPVIVLSGAIEPGSEVLYREGITAMFASVRRIDSLEHVLADARENLAVAAADIFRLIAAIT
jgi:glycerate kinase